MYSTLDEDGAIISGTSLAERRLSRRQDIDHIQVIVDDLDLLLGQGLRIAKLEEALEPVTKFLRCHRIPLQDARTAAM